MLFLDFGYFLFTFSNSSQIQIQIQMWQVSAGYDAHWRDPLASLQMRSSTYYRLAANIKALADSLSGELDSIAKELLNSDPIVG